MATWTFNRRTVEDQEIYVEAETLAEAWRRARSDSADDTTDVRVLKVTLRRLTPTPSDGSVM